MRLNPNNYNVWSFRRKVLKNIKYDPRKELCWVEELIRENPKNFYAWEHRRSISNSNLSQCDADTELDLTEDILEKDAKSYHAWQHRQWTLQTHKFTNSGLMKSEVKFTEKMLASDVRNNSAWNQRFFLIKQRGKIDFFLVKKDFSFVVEKIKIVIDNESAWNYLRGILEQFKEIKKLPQYEEFKSFLEKEFYEKHNNNRHLVAFIIDAKIEMVLDEYESNELIHSQKVYQLCNLMADRFDKIRKNYWKFVYKKFHYDKIKKRHETNEAGGAKEDQTWKTKIGKRMDDKSSETSLLEQPTKDKEKSKEKLHFKKSEKHEKASGIGTDLLFEIMNKYNH